MQFFVRQLEMHNIRRALIVDKPMVVLWPRLTKPTVGVINLPVVIVYGQGIS